MWHHETDSVRRQTMTVQTPTTKDLRELRKALVDQLPGGEKPTRRRLTSYQVTPEELETIRRIDEVDYLLGK